MFLIYLCHNVFSKEFKIKRKEKKRKEKLHLIFSDLIIIMKGRGPI